MEERLIDYFAVVGAGDTINFLNDYAEDGSLLENSHILDAQVLSRYPLADHPDVSFPQMLERFTFPIGIHAEARTGREEPIPTYFVFVSSVKRNIKLYGHCLTFYEELKISQHSMKPSVRNFLKKRLEERQSQSRRGLSTKDIRLFVPKAFVISSRHSFPSFRELLAELYRISCSSVSVPLERYIVHLLSELPMPPLGRSSLQVDFESKTLTFARPPPNTVGNFTAPLHLVFRCLSLENILTVFSALLAERHVSIAASWCCHAGIHPCVVRHDSTSDHSSVQPIFLADICGRGVAFNPFPFQMAICLYPRFASRHFYCKLSCCASHPIQS